jgi:hypothetical protein
MNKKEILFPVALNSKGELCYAKDAPKGEKYYCTECENEMILKRSESCKRRPHFAHKQASPGCYPETVLHNTYKNFLFKKLENALIKKETIYMEWDCKICKEKHTVNLLENIDAVQLESYTGDYKPDIVLLRQGKPGSVIEIIVTHKPQESAENYYNSENIPVIKIFLESDEDIYNVNNNPLTPPSVEYCIELPKCPKCGNYMGKKHLNLGTYECWRCNIPYKVSWITTGNVNAGDFYGPEGFTDYEIKIAKEKGIIIEKRYSKTMEESYNANICPHCGSFLGEFFIHDLLYTEEEKILTGYRCLSCGYEIRAIEEDKK